MNNINERVRLFNSFTGWLESKFPGSVREIYRRLAARKQNEFNKLGAFHPSSGSSFGTGSSGFGLSFPGAGIVAPPAGTTNAGNWFTDTVRDFVDVIPDVVQGWGNYRLQDKALDVSLERMEQGTIPDDIYRYQGPQPPLRISVDETGNYSDDGMFGGNSNLIIAGLILGGTLLFVKK